MSEQVQLIAKRVKELREICGMTAEELAKQIGVDYGIYIGYEDKGEDIPISVLYSISHKLGVDMAELLTGATPRLDTYCVARKGEGVKVDRFPGYSFQNLAYKFLHKKMEPLMVEVEPSEKRPKAVTHPGQEFNMVMEGTVMVFIDNKEVVLNEGDSIYFDPTHPHGQMAMNDKPARFLTIILE